MNAETFPFYKTCWGGASPGKLLSVYPKGCPLLCTPTLPWKWPSPPSQAPAPRPQREAERCSKLTPSLWPGVDKEPVQGAKLGLAPHLLILAADASCASHVHVFFSNILFQRVFGEPTGGQVTFSSPLTSPGLW